MSIKTNCFLSFQRERSRSPRQSGEDDPLAIHDDELAVVGIPDDADIAQIFEPSGMYKILICEYLYSCHDTEAYLSLLLFSSS